MLDPNSQISFTNKTAEKFALILYSIVKLQTLFLQEKVKPKFD